MTDFTDGQFLRRVRAALLQGELEGVMLLLTDHQLPCGFWKALGSLLSTLFRGVSPRLMFLLFFFSQHYMQGVHVHTLTDTQKDGKTLEFD